MSGTGPDVAALVADLVFATKIGGAVRGAGGRVRIVRTPGELAAADDAVVLIDLETEGALEAVAAAAQRSPRPRIVAFGPHVRGDLLDAARAAGADEALPRSAFARRLEKDPGSFARPA